MSNVTIDKELLSDIYAFIDDMYSQLLKRELADSDTRNEWERLGDLIEAALEWHEPAPVADPVTYTVMWQGRDTGTDAEGISKVEAADMVRWQNELWFPTINHWAVGSDGSIIGRVGAP